MQYKNFICLRSHSQVFQFVNVKRQNQPKHCVGQQRKYRPSKTSCKSWDFSIPRSLKKNKNKFIVSNAFGPRMVLCPSGFIIFCLPKILHTYHITQGWSTSQKHARNPLVSSQTFFGCQPTFFCPPYSFLLMSNKNLSFFAFKHHIGGGQLPKNMHEILQSLAELFLAASRPFFVRSIVCF